MKIQGGNYPSIEQLQDQYYNQSTSKSSKTEEGKSFQNILSEKVETNKSSTNEEVHFSKHATNRLEDRNIALTNEQLERLTKGTQMAGEKGIKESLVIIDKLAFIVNITNSTVITAMDQTETNENIFTNIDGAVIA